SLLLDVQGLRRERGDSTGSGRPGVPTAVGADRLSLRELRLLAALCEPLLAFAGGEPATYRAIASRLGGRATARPGATAGGSWRRWLGGRSTLGRSTPRVLICCCLLGEGIWQRSGCCAEDGEFAGGAAGDQEARPVGSAEDEPGAGADGNGRGDLAGMGIHGGYLV